MTDVSIESLILNNLVNNEPYTRKAMPHIKPEYFTGYQRVIYELILDFISKYNKLPNASVLDIEFQKSNAAVRPDRHEILQTIHNFSKPESVEHEWLVDSTEKWCKDRAVHLAVMEAISIIDGKSADKAEGAIPEILNKALSVTFNTDVGHDYLENADRRYEFYHRVESKLSFDIDMFNQITNGGISRKTLNIILGGTNVGKSLVMCHLASADLLVGRNVLYITLEMAEERIAERIDANLLDVDINELGKFNEDRFVSKVNSIRSKTNGKLIIKEYPTASAHVGHFRALLHELKLKKKFVPDVIYIDYLNICTSSRMKGVGGSINTYVLIKSIAEEIRGLAVEFNVPIWSATQVTRSGMQSSDIDITDTSECIALTEKVEMRDGGFKTIDEINIGDQIKANDDYKTVMFRHHNKIKDCIKIKTKNGNEIVVSKDHVFPIKDIDGIVKRLSYSHGLKIGHQLNTKKFKYTDS
jgi:replicative DNA helicase